MSLLENFGLEQEEIGFYAIARRGYKAIPPFKNAAGNWPSRRTGGSWVEITEAVEEYAEAAWPAQTPVGKIS